MMLNNITCLETKITILEVKEMLTEKERQSVSKMVKRLDALSLEFMTYCFSLLDQTEHHEKLSEEHVVLDDHKEKVEELMECLQDLVATPEPVMPHTSCTTEN